MARTSLLGLVVVVGAVVMIGVLLAHSGGVSQASPAAHGDLLLDAATGDNTATDVGTVTRQLCNVAVDSTVRIDVVAVNAADWAAMDFVIYLPSPIVVQRPGPDDGGLDQNPGFGDSAAGFDFVPFDGSTADTFGSQNFLFPNNTDNAEDYSTTEGVPDGSSPHGVSMFDNALVGNTGSGGMARLSLDTTDLPVGEYTLLLGKTPAFGGGVHSDASGFQLDHFGALTLAIGQACSTDTDGDGVSDTDETTFGSDPNDIDSIPENDQWLPEYSNPNFANPPGDVPPCSDGVDNDGDGLVDAADPTCGLAVGGPTATSTPSPTDTPTSAVLPTGAQPTATATAVPPIPATGGPPTGVSGNDWLIVLYVAGGVIAAMTAGGAVSWRLRRRATRAK